MKRHFIAAGVALMLLSSCTGLQQSATTTTGSQSSNILSQLAGSGGSTLTNILEGVFAQSNLTVADLSGKWTVKGSAVAFQSENFLAQAGGLAAAGAIEGKLDPYYERYGLTGATFTIQEDGSFTTTIKGMQVSGTVTAASDGNFIFSLKALGIVDLGNMKTYVTKSGNNLDLMFDAKKLKELLGVAAQLSGNKLASSATSLLDNYEGIMVGVSMTKTGNAEKTNRQTTTSGSLLDLLGR